MERYGAAIERGRVMQITDEGVRIASFCREGIVTPPLPVFRDVTISVDDTVYFFLFEDGAGMILAQA